MNRRLKREIRSCAIIAGSAAILGAVFGIAIAVGGDGETRAATVAAAAFRGVWTGGFIASLLVATETFFINGAAGAWVRRLSFSAQLLLRSLLYLLVIVAGIQSGAALFPVTASTPFGWNSETAMQLGFSLVISLAVNFAMSVNRLLGQAVFLNFVTGRYHRPVVEPRVLLFVDLVGSTAAAQAIGDLAFHSLLRDVYRDLTGPVIERRGVIEKYVGDEMIVSWPDRPGTRLAALRCGLDFGQVLDRAADRYRRDYGLAPRLRGAVHAGPVVMGEMGEVRQEIVMLGDAMNTTARMVDLCRSHGCDLLASDAVLDESLRRPESAAAAGLRITDIGSTAIRGRNQPLHLYALTRAIAPH
ncbi:MAG: adenylate/guanylate cyclase domain-containing protein [Minwuia sp.]|nr:adenylate/guanylate cyclase domain-containing protein [Minwuia sp.]